MIDLREYVRELHMKSIYRSNQRAGSTKQLKILLNKEGRGGGGSNDPSSDWGGGMHDLGGVDRFSRGNTTVKVGNGNFKESSLTVIF